MRFLSTSAVAVLLALCCINNCTADEAARLMKYFSFFEGTWDVTHSDGNKGILKIAKGVSGQCHVLSFEVGDSKSDEICGYSPTTKKWTCSGFSATGARYSYVMNDPPKREHVETGDKFFALSSGLTRDGDETSSRLLFTVTANDAYTINITERMSGDEKEEDVVLKFKRKK